MFRGKIIAALFDVNSRGAEIAWTGRLETLPGCSPFTLGNFLKTWPPAMTRLRGTKRRTICIDANYAIVYPRQLANCFATKRHIRDIDDNPRDNEFS